MLRSRREYDAIAKIVIDIYRDYDIKKFPIDVFDICRKSGIDLVPYSEFSEREVSLLKKRSMDAFFVPATKCSPFMIFYNDNLQEVKSEGRQRFSIMHEVKHYVCNEMEETEEGEDLADYFARYFLCPIPVLIVRGIYNQSEIISEFKISASAAANASKSLQNRMKRYNNSLFEYEKPLIIQLFGDEYLEGGGDDDSDKKQTSP